MNLQILNLFFNFFKHIIIINSKKKLSRYKFIVSGFKARSSDDENMRIPTYCECLKTMFF